MSPYRRTGPPPMQMTSTVTLPDGKVATRTGTTRYRSVVAVQYNDNDRLLAGTWSVLTWIPWKQNAGQAGRRAEQARWSGNYASVRVLLTDQFKERI